MQNGESVYRVVDETYEYAFSAVPDSKRKDTSRLLVILVGFACSTSGIAVGAELGKHLPFWQAVSACALGNLLLFCIALFWGLQGYKTGYTSMILVKNTLGKQMGCLFSVLVILSAILWVGMNGELIGNIMIASFPSWPLPIAFTVLLMIMAGTLLVQKGWRGLEQFARLLVPVIGLLALYSVFRIGIARDGLGYLLAFRPDEPLTFAAATTIAMGNFSAPACTMPNLCRFARSRRAVLHCLIAHTLALTANNISGILIIQATGAKSLNYGIYLLGMVMSNFAWMLVCAYTTQNVHMYTGSLALQSLVKGTGMGGNISHRSAVLYIGGLSAIVGIIGIARYLSVVTSALVLVLMPLTGIFAAELLLRDRLGPVGTSAPVYAWLLTVLAGAVLWRLSGDAKGALLILIAGGIYALLRLWTWRRAGQKG